MVAYSLNTNTVEPRGERSPLPPGEYPVFVKKTERKEVRSQNGNELLSVEFQIYEGRFRGRKLWANFNLWNSNSSAVEIAEQELAELCRAVGIVDLGDTQQLHDKDLTVKVIQKTRPDGNIGNEITEYKNASRAAIIPDEVRRPTKLPAPGTSATPTQQPAMVNDDIPF